MVRQTPTRRLRVIVLAIAGAGMLATAALAATSTPPNGAYGKVPSRGGYGGYGGYGQATPGYDDDGSGPDDGGKPDKKKDKKAKKKDRQVNKDKQRQQDKP